MVGEKGLEGNLGDISYVEVRKNLLVPDCYKVKAYCGNYGDSNRSDRLISFDSEFVGPEKINMRLDDLISYPKFVEIVGPNSRALGETDKGHNVHRYSVTIPNIDCAGLLAMIVRAVEPEREVNSGIYRKAV